jgi:hypothetical protein
MLSRRELILLGLLFVVSLPAVTTRFYASDEIEHFAWLRSIAFDRDADFQDEYQHFYDADVSRSPDFHETFLERTTEAGRRINYASPGSALLWSPFYAIGHLVARATGAPADGFSHPYIAAVTYASACYGFLAVLFSALIARRIVGNGVVASLCVAIGSPLVFYTYVAPGFGHATSAFAVSLFVWTWIRVRERWSLAGALALGLTGGLMALVREQDVFLTIGPAIDFLLDGFRPGARHPARTVRWPILAALTGVVSFGLAYAPQLMAYQALNGHPGPTETAARKMTWTSPHGLSVLFDVEHGLFAWTPLALFCVAGLVLLAWRGAGGPDSADRVSNRDGRRIALLALLMIGLQAYTSGSVASWTVSGSFGQRRFVAITPLLVLGLAAWFSHARTAWPRRAVAVVIALCIWWNLGLVAQFGLNRMSRAGLELGKNARVTFIDLPREAPSIVWRYLFDRKSLYKLPRQ